MFITELTGIIYRAIVAVNEENYKEDKIPSQVEMAERIANEVVLYLNNNLNLKQNFFK